MSTSVKVCVTGGAGYIASYLIKHLLERGYTVHATLRNLSDASKVGLLKGLAHAETRLKLFEADIYKSDEFAAAIDGCSFVFHLATPFQHYANNSQYKNTSEAAVAGVKMIVESCIKSSTVKRLIYTASVMAAAPLKEDGSGYKDIMDETCWTPLQFSYYEVHSVSLKLGRIVKLLAKVHRVEVRAVHEFIGGLVFVLAQDYINSKTLAEKEVLSYNGKGIEVVSLACALVGGDTIQSAVSSSMDLLISQAMNNGLWYKGLRELEDLDSKVPIVHIEDVVEAHIFSMENSDISGRFLLANAFLKSAEIASLIQKHHPDITIPPEFIEDTKRETKWGSRKLQDLGFEYKFDADKIVDDSIACGKRLGEIV